MFVRLFCLYGEPGTYACKTMGSTHLMNFATHEGMYCLFPESTLQRRWMLVSPGQRGLWSKFIDAGFQFASLWDCLHLREFQGVRRFGDGLSVRKGFVGRRYSSRNGLSYMSFWMKDSGVQMVYIVD